LRSTSQTARFPAPNCSAEPATTPITAGDGNDTPPGGNGNDTPPGGNGNDVIIGGRGNDTARLGAGDDTLVWNPGDGSELVEGRDDTDTLVFNSSKFGAVEPGTTLDPGL
jgi:Ca2+-binding RTX toxin-like protein